MVTGGGRGIGLAIARSLAEDGASVVVSGRDAGRLDAAVVEIEGAGAPALAVVADVGRARTWIGSWRPTRERFGRIDVLVNNAGITRDRLLVRMKDEDWDQVLDTNLRGVFLTTRAVGKVMIRQKAGRIINIGSAAGSMGNPGQVNYSAAKAGRDRTHEGGGPGAGPLEYPGQCGGAGADRDGHDRRHPAAAREALMVQVPLKRIGTGREVAETVRFLAGDGAGYITGQVIHVNGGLYM